MFSLSTLSIKSLQICVHRIVLTINRKSCAQIVIYILSRFSARAINIKAEKFVIFSYN